MKEGQKQFISDEEIAKAEAITTDEEKAMSERREKSPYADFPEVETKVKIKTKEGKMHVMERYINKHILEKKESAGEEIEGRFLKQYIKMPEKEKVEELYSLIISYQLGLKNWFNKKKEGKTEEEGYKANLRLISRIKVLMKDDSTRELFFKTYGKARLEVSEFRVSELAKNWKRKDKKLTQLKQEREKLEVDLFHEKIEEETDIKEALLTIADLSLEINDVREEKNNIETLNGLPRVKENTDYAAMIQNEKLNKYRDELEKGFVWMPTREKIDEEAMEVIISSGNPKQTRQGVFFLSEPGSGKTEQIRAIARRLTGDNSIKISCGPRTGKPQLLGATKAFSGATEIEKGTYEDFRGENLKGTLTSALTGYDYSYEKEPKRNYAQVVEFDEMPKLFGNENVFGILKDFYSLRDGDKLSDKPVFPGRVHFASGNLGPAYGVSELPKALDRHYKVIPVDFLEMTKENPEIYEFMLTCLKNKDTKRIAVSKKELSPAYKKRELPEDEKETLSDGSVVVAVQELIEKTTSIEHGFLYRFANAVKAIQNSYLARGGENAYIDYTDRELLRERDGSVTDTGDPIILQGHIRTTDIIGWLMSYGEEKRKNKNINTLTEWIQGKLREKIKERKDDAKFLEAIFNHFHLFDAPPVIDKDEDPMTDIDQGYLSTRVPRPVIVEKQAVPKNEDDNEDDSKKTKPQEIIERETREVLLDEDGTWVKIRVQEFNLPNGIYDLNTNKLILLEVPLGQKIRFANEDFIFGGIVEDEESPYNGQAICRLPSGENLYKIFSSSEIDIGVIENFNAGLKEIFSDYKADIKEFWKDECKDEKEPAYEE